MERQRTAGRPAAEQAALDLPPPHLIHALVLLLANIIGDFVLGGGREREEWWREGEGVVGERIRQIE